MNTTLWTKNYTRLIIATVFGCIGGIASNFALSFLVFDETNSILASSIILAIQFIPGFIVPLILAPCMDRFSRKIFLVGGDIINGILYLLAGMYLMHYPFHYVGYLFFSLFLSMISSADQLAYNSIYPNVIPKGMEEKGYSISALLYPVLQVIMMPFAAILMEWVGISWILLMQGVFSILAAIIESKVEIDQKLKKDKQRFNISLWYQDIKEVINYLKNEKGLKRMFSYMALVNGVNVGYSPLLVAFFRVTPGLTSAMYALFSVAEFIGRTIGGVLHYHVKIEKKKRFYCVYGINQIYLIMDMCLLWIPYPWMLINRGVCGFLGIHSATTRQSTIQQYVPDHIRARVNAYLDICILFMGSISTVLIGIMGEYLDAQTTITLCAFFVLVYYIITIWMKRSEIKKVYENTCIE